VFRIRRWRERAARGKAPSSKVAISSHAAWEPSQEPRRADQGAAKVTEIHELTEAEGVALRLNGAIVEHKVHWREEGYDGVRRNAAKRSRSASSARSSGRARRQRPSDRRPSRSQGRGELVLRPDSAARVTVGDLFKEWITEHAALNLSERYATDAVRWWDREIATRSIAVCASRASPTTGADHAFPGRPHSRRPLDRVPRAGAEGPPLRAPLGTAALPAHPDGRVSGLFSLPSQQRKRLIYAEGKRARSARALRGRGDLLPPPRSRA
jgi:hypothetical protein